MKAAGVARKQNRERLALTARLDKKLSDAATECMKKMVTSDIVRVRSLWKDWSWIKGTQVRKMPSFEPFDAENDHFTKTGSGQTW